MSRAQSDLRSIRQALETAECPLIQKLSNTELESCLFESSPDRLRLLQWCLSQLDPSLCESFLKWSEEETEKEVVELGKSFGLANDSDIILGLAGCKEQKLLWVRLFDLMRAADKLKRSPSPLKTLGLTHLQVLSSLVQSADVEELIRTKVKLIPVTLCVDPVTDSRKSLKEDLEQAQALLDEAASTLMRKNEESPDIYSAENYSKKHTEEILRIRECFQYLASSVLPLVKNQPKDPINDPLGGIIGNLAEHVISFVQMLKDTEDIKKIAEELQDLKSSSQNLVETDEVQQILSKSHSLISEVLSLIKLHNIM